MKFVIQRVSNASCTVEGNITGSIQKGFLVLIGISDQDTIQIADKMIKKLLGMRIFEDSDGKTNLSLHDVNGELLLISQFTLYADCRKGNRPSFTNAGKPDIFVDEDNGWTIYTEDNSMSAQWEIQVLVTEDGYEIIAY